MKFLIAFWYSLDILIWFCLMLMGVCFVLMSTILSVASIYAWAPSLEPYLDTILLVEEILGGACAILSTAWFTKKKIATIRRSWAEIENT